jgi:hypothetical protein
MGDSQTAAVCAVLSAFLLVAWPFSPLRDADATAIDPQTSLPRDHVVGIRVDVIAVGSYLQVGAVRPSNHTLADRIWSSSTAAQCDVRIRHVAIISAVNLNIVLRSPRIIVVTHERRVASRRSNAAFWISWIIYYRWRDVDDLSRVYRCRGLTSRTYCSARPKFVEERRIKWIERGVKYVPTITGIGTRGRSRVFAVISVKRVHGVHDLGEIVFCLGVPSLVLDCFERRKKQPDEDPDDGDNHQEFNEGKCCGGISSHSAGIMALMRPLHKRF